MPSFIALTLTDMDLGLTHLFKEHGKAIAETNTGKTYGKLLRASHEELLALPQLGDGTRPLSDELAAVDATHDAYGAAIWYLIEAHAKAPSTPEPQRKALTVVREALVASLQSLRAPYADEAAAARAHRAACVEHRAVLRAVPVTKKSTLEDWALAYVEAGEKIGALLVERAEKTPAPRTKAGRLRSRVLGLLSRFREGLGDEFGDDPERAEEIDRTWFGYLDQLEAQRAEATARTIANAADDEGDEGDKPDDKKPAGQDTDQGTSEKNPAR